MTQANSVKSERTTMTYIAREILDDCGTDVDDVEEMELEDILEALDY